MYTYLTKKPSEPGESSATQVDCSPDRVRDVMKTCLDIILPVKRSYHSASSLNEVGHSGREEKQADSPDNVP